MFSLWFLSRALCLALFVGAYDLSRLRLRLFTSRQHQTPRYAHGQQEGLTGVAAKAFWRDAAQLSAP